MFDKHAANTDLRGLILGCAQAQIISFVTTGVEKFRWSHGKPIGIHVAEKFISLRVGRAQRPQEMTAGDRLLRFGEMSVLRQAQQVRLMAERLLNGHDIDMIALAEGHELPHVVR